MGLLALIGWGLFLACVWCAIGIYTQAKWKIYNGPVHKD